MINVKDANGVLIRSFNVHPWTPDGGYPRTEITDMDVIFSPDEEGTADQINWVDVNDPKQSDRKTKLEKYPHADPNTLFQSAKANKYGVLIRCVESGETRRIWTCDLHQVARSEKIQTEYRKNAAKGRKKAKKAATPDAAPADASTAS